MPGDPRRPNIMTRLGGTGDSLPLHYPLEPLPPTMWSAGVGRPVWGRGFAMGGAAQSPKSHGKPLGCGRQKRGECSDRFFSLSPDRKSVV